MIQLKISHLDHSAKLTFPAKYERVVLALWSIGLDHDPEKYTLRRLGAEFSFTTEEESRMVQLIDPGNTLRQAMCLLSEMMYPPYPAAERIHKKMATGGYSSEEDFFVEMESLVYDSNAHYHTFYFPVSGEVVNKQGLVRTASDPLLLKYELLIDDAIRRVQRQICGSETKLFAKIRIFICSDCGNGIVILYCIRQCFSRLGFVSGHFLFRGFSSRICCWEHGKEHYQHQEKRKDAL